MGIGDGYGQSATPDERLDVLDRTIMNRRLVPDYEDGQLDRLMVQDFRYFNELRHRAGTTMPARGAV